MGLPLKVILYHSEKALRSNNLSDHKQTIPSAVRTGGQTPSTAVSLCAIHDLRIKFGFV